MTVKKVLPSYEAAVKETIAAVKAVRDADADADLLPVLRSKMFNEAFLDKNYRQAMLKDVNKELGTSFTMNQVRKANPALLNAEIDKVKGKHKSEKMQIVDELHGSVQLPSGRKVTNNPEPTSPDVAETVKAIRQGFMAVLFEQGFNDLDSAKRELVYSSFMATLPEDIQAMYGLLDEEAVDPDDKFFGFLGADEKLWQAFLESFDHFKSAFAVIAEQTQQTINAVTPTTLENTMTNANTTKAQKAAQEKTAENFISLLIANGHVTEEGRDALYNAFLAAHPDYSKAAAAASQANKTANNDHQFFAFVSSNDGIEKAFEEFVKGYEASTDLAMEAPRSRFSFTGENDSGIRSGWVSVMGAVVGAGLEIVRTGNVTIGTGVGAAVGIGASFFAGEFIDSKIEGSVGRYAAASVLGLALGGIGATAGRMVEGGIAGAIQSRSEHPEVMVQVPTLQLPSLAVVPANETAASSIRGFIPGF